MTDGEPIADPILAVGALDGVRTGHDHAALYPLGDFGIFRQSNRGHQTFDGDNLEAAVIGARSFDAGVGGLDRYDLADGEALRRPVSTTTSDRRTVDYLGCHSLGGRLIDEIRTDATWRRIVNQRQHRSIDCGDLKAAIVVLRTFDGDDLADGKMVIRPIAVGAGNGVGPAFDATKSDRTRIVGNNLAVCKVVLDLGSVKAHVTRESDISKIKGRRTFQGHVLERDGRVIGQFGFVADEGLDHIVDVRQSDRGANPDVCTKGNAAGQIINPRVAGSSNHEVAAGAGVDFSAVLHEGDRLRP